MITPTALITFPIVTLSPKFTYEATAISKSEHL